MLEKKKCHIFKSFLFLGSIIRNPDPDLRYDKTLDPDPDLY